MAWASGAGRMSAAVHSGCTTAAAARRSSSSPPSLPTRPALVPLPSLNLFQWVNVDEYSGCEPDKIVLCNPNRTLQVLNENYSGARRLRW